MRTATSTQCVVCHKTTGLAMGEVKYTDIGDDLDKYVDAILENRGDCSKKLVLTSDDVDDEVSMSQVMAEVALRAVERIFGPPSEWNLKELTVGQWEDFKSLFWCTEWVPCVACPIHLPQFNKFNVCFCGNYDCGSIECAYCCGACDCDEHVRDDYVCDYCRGYCRSASAFFIPCCTCGGQLNRGSTIPGHYVWQYSKTDPAKNTLIDIQGVGAENIQLLLWMEPTYDCVK